IEDAWVFIEQWLTLPNVWIPQPLERHSEILGKLLTQSNAPANLVPDAHLAAIAVEHGLTVYSCDSDFARFKKSTWINPLGKLCV
ncbi:MAG: type II toxin-antitoxin system VapC family toxin, partial [Gammaproteobacteria bacterium]|nr:type II toxin-antitoxin system VapC family toxin [Gammaproteobacteria bacterium]